jgi:hypothetical protein
MLTIMITTTLFVGVGFLINLVSQAPKELQVPPKLGKSESKEAHAKLQFS